MKSNVTQCVENTPTTNSINGIDRLTMFIDRPELPFSKNLLFSQCKKVDILPQQPKYQANRKLKIDLFQPTRKCVKLLRKELGREICVDITYVEIARDWVPSYPDQLNKLVCAFLSSAQMPYQRDTVLLVEGTTWYYSRGRIDGHNLVVYADKPSKINAANPLKGAPLCLHVEWRATGKEALKNLGIAALDDLINFDFDRHWSSRLNLYAMPTKKALGLKLARLCEGKVDASQQAHLKRSNIFLKRHSKNGFFVLQNALNSMPELSRRLKLLTWQEWTEIHS